VQYNICDTLEYIYARDDDGDDEEDERGVCWSLWHFCPVFILLVHTVSCLCHVVSHTVLDAHIICVFLVGVGGLPSEAIVPETRPRQAKSEGGGSWLWISIKVSEALLWLVLPSSSSAYLRHLR